MKRHDELSAVLKNGDFVFGVCDGVLGRQHFLSDGRRSIVELCTHGDLIDPQIGAADMELVALTPVKLVTFPRDIFENERKKPSDLGAIYDQLAERRSNQILQHCADICKKTPPERMASFLMEYRGRQPGELREMPDYHLELKGREVGDYMSLEPETVSRCYSRLVEEGVIKLYASGKIEVTDEDRLREIAEGGMPRKRRKPARHETA